MYIYANNDVSVISHYLLICWSFVSYLFSVWQENEVLRKQNVQLSEENGKLVGHKNHKQRIEYLVKLKKENTKLQEVSKTIFCHQSMFLLARVDIVYTSYQSTVCISSVLKENEKLRTEVSAMRDNFGSLPLEMT